MHLVLKTGPTKEPVSLEDVKAVVGLQSDQKQFDALMRNLMTSGVNHFERETNTVIMEQNWCGYIDDWPLEEEYIEVYRPPLLRVNSIKYTDSTGQQQTWSSSDYDIDSNIKPGRIYLGYLKSWPTATLAPISNAIEIDFDCGYGEQEDVPEDIKTAIKLLVEYWFTNRGESDGIPKGIQSMIMKYKIYYL